MSSRISFSVNVLVLTFALFLTLQEANRMNFWGHPMVVKNEDTGTFRLSCRVGDNETGPNSSPNSFNMKELSTIHIARGRDYSEVATLHASRIDAIKGKTLPTNVIVHGEVSRDKHSGYLEVTWLHPVNLSRGGFHCRVYGLTNESQPIDAYRFTDVRVLNKPPDALDVASHINRLKTKMASTKVKMHLEIDNIKWNLPYAQEGRISCTGQCKCKQVTFPKPYRTTPQVIFAPVRMDIPKQYNTRLSIYTRSMSNKGFLLCGYTWQDTRLYSLDMVWMSIGV